jgi:hypothetical protein
MEITDPGCFFHGDEPVPSDWYRLCGECGHCFDTVDDLLLADNRNRIEIGLQPITDPTLVLFCPLCTHDF